MENLDDLDAAVEEFLNRNYFHGGMWDYRHKLLEASSDIACKMIYSPQNLTLIDGCIMRDAWECSRTGLQNVACIAFAEVGACDYPEFENINAMINMLEFLSKKEKWHTARMRKKENYSVSRMFN